MLREISQEVFQDPSDVNFIFLFLLIYFFFVFEIPRWGFLRAWLSCGRSMGGGAWLPLILGKKEKGLHTEKKLAGQGTKYHPHPLPPTLANWIPSFLGIPNSKEFSKIPNYANNPCQLNSQFSNYANKLWNEKLGIWEFLEKENSSSVRTWNS